MERWLFEGFELQTKAYNVDRGASAGIGLPPRRGENLSVPFLDGRRHVDKHFDQRVITLNMWVRGVDPQTGIPPAAREQERQLLHDHIDTLNQLFGSRTAPGALRLVFPDGSIRQAQAEVVDALHFVRDNSRFARFSVDLLLADPFFYAIQQTVDLRSVPASPTNWTHTNAGTARVKKAIITLAGPLSEPKVECITTGTWVQFLGDVGPAESVVLDCETFMATKGASSVIGSVRHDGDACWLVLAPGDNDMRVTAAGVGGSCEIRYYAPYF